MTKKWLIIVKKSTKTIGIIVMILFTVYIGLGLYIDSHQKELLDEVRTIASEKCKGEVTIGDLNIRFFKNFPNITVEIENIVVKDSLWASHKNTLLDAKAIAAEIQPWSILRKKINISNVQILDATINLYVSQNGYSNTSVFSNSKKASNEESSTRSLDLTIKTIELRNVIFKSENKGKFKKFDFTINKLSLATKSNSTGWQATTDLETRVNSMAFNTRYGSFAKEKLIKGKLLVDFDTSIQTIKVKTDGLAIGNDVFQINASFGLGKSNSKYAINIRNSAIQWKAAYNLLSDNISNKLKKFDFKNDFSVKCDIIGDLQAFGDPFIHVIANINDNQLSYLEYKISNCNFKGEFTNQSNNKQETGDANSAVILHNFRGNLETVPFTTKNMKIVDFTRPIASGSLTSNFSMQQLNNTNLNKLFKFTRGDAKIQVDFKADVVNLEMKKPNVVGKLLFKNVDYIYIPKKMDFKFNTFDIEFTTDQLKVNNITIQNNNSSIVMSGYSNNFMNLYYDNPEKISLYWTAKATKLRLEDFYTGASPNQPAVAVKNKSKSNSNYSKNISTDLIKTLHQSKATIKLIAKELSYKKFKSKNIIANIRIANDSIKVDRASMIFAKGTVQATGTITHQKKSSPFAIQLKMQNVDLQKTLYTFDNFESTTITDKNTRGTVSVTANLKGQLTQNAQIVKNSINGFTIVAIKNGALINFKPIKLVGKYVFPFRDFNNVSFAPLYIDMTINNSLVKIKPTAINSSVINMDFAGVYGFRGNTNMQLDVHLRDPQKDKGNTNKKEVQQNRKKGITLHLQAIEDKGEMKIKLRSRNEKLQ